jgi:hypothetical protein
MAMVFEDFAQSGTGRRFPPIISLRCKITQLPLRVTWCGAVAWSLSEGKADIHSDKDSLYRERCVAYHRRQPSSRKTSREMPNFSFVQRFAHGRAGP